MQGGAEYILLSPPIDSTAHREARGLSIEALAAEAGIHRTYVTGIENGRYNPSWKVVGAIADALGVKISDLAGEAEEARS